MVDANAGAESAHQMVYPADCAERLARLLEALVPAGGDALPLPLELQRNLGSDVFAVPLPPPDVRGAR